MKPIVYFIRGVSGSGKSTLAKQLIEARKRSTGNVIKHVEADMFFEKDGEYKFDPSRIKEAHVWAKRQLVDTVAKGQDVVVSNTFTRKWEVDGYLDLIRNDASFIIIRAVGNYENVHGVSAEAVQAMRDRWEDYANELIADYEFVETFFT